MTCTRAIFLPEASTRPAIYSVLEQQPFETATGGIHNAHFQ